MSYYSHSSTLVISLDMVVLYYVIIMNHLLIFHYYRYNSLVKKGQEYIIVSVSCPITDPSATYQPLSPPH
jgi:hypothetical protein